jgi:hypothetical protein
MNPFWASRFPAMHLQLFDITNLNLLSPPLALLKGLNFESYSYARCSELASASTARAAQASTRNLTICHFPRTNTTNSLVEPTDCILFQDECIPQVVTYGETGYDETMIP